MSVVVRCADDGGRVAVVQDNMVRFSTGVYRRRRGGQRESPQAFTWNASVTDPYFHKRGRDGAIRPECEKCGAEYSFSDVATEARRAAARGQTSIRLRRKADTL